MYLLRLYSSLCGLVFKSDYALDTRLPTPHEQDGDEISPGDVLCDIETDKATMAFEAQVCMHYVYMYIGVYVMYI